MHETARQKIENLINAAGDQLQTNRSFTSVLIDLERALNDTFGWQPIERADEFHLRTPAPGKFWGPRIVVLVNNMSHIAYWDLDVMEMVGGDARPFWRTLHKTPAWSRRNQPSHFLRPFSV